ncbi:recombinase family protein [Streptococcus alactolyticus]|uniref:recombinase family protein n=1 Tax=Streptococcus alactolyticus TaxID=29389 RepID=UPI003F9C1FCD
MRCASYTRATSCFDEKSIPSDIISIQNKHIENYIKNRGWELVEKYSDRKKDPLEETAFLKMKDDALGRKYECLVIDSFDRCGRTNAVAKELFEFLFIPAGISFAVVEDDFCSCDKEDYEIAEYLQGKLTQYNKYRTKITNQSHSEKRKYQKYGFVYGEDETVLNIDPEAAKVIRYIYDLLIEGLTQSQVAKRLTEEGVLSKRAYIKQLCNMPIEEKDIPWRSNEIRDILYKRIYLGEWERTVNGKKQMFSCPAIVDMEIYKKAKEICESRRPYNQEKRRLTPNPIAGLFKDEESGMPITSYIHPSRRIRIFRFCYPKEFDVSYKKAYIEYDEVMQELMHAIEREHKKALFANDMIESEKAQVLKDKYIDEYREPARAIFQQMLQVENQQLPLYQCFQDHMIDENEYMNRFCNS